MTQDKLRGGKEIMMRASNNRFMRYLQVALGVVVMSVGMARYGHAVVPSVQETVKNPDVSAVSVHHYQDWQVFCFKGQERPRCEMTQEMYDKRNHMKVASLEITPRRHHDAFVGLLILPLGVDVDRRVHLMDGNGNILTPLHVRACLADGCLVPIELSHKTMDIINKDHFLVVRMTSVSGHDLVVPVSLKGFQAAFLNMKHQST